MKEEKFIIFSSDDGVEADALSSAADGAGSERRRYTRRRVGVLTEIEAKGSGSLPGITFNMSRSGAYILTLAPLEPGEDVVLCFISDSGQKERVTGRVVHGAELKNDMFWSQGVGVEFVEGTPSFFEVAFSEEDGLEGAAPIESGGQRNDSSGTQ